jgi:RNA polymerase primary sigma factor
MLHDFEEENVIEFNEEDTEPNDEDLALLEDEPPETKNGKQENDFAPDAAKLYSEAISKTTRLTPEEEIILGRQVRAGNKESKKRFIVSNLRLVMKIAGRYRGQGIDFLDLVQAGTFGLTRAVEKFDPERGYKFSTYATWWIRQSIDREIMNFEKTIRVPVHIQRSLKNEVKVKKELAILLRRDPTEEDLTTALGEETFKKNRRFEKQMRSTSVVSYEELFSFDDRKNAESFIEDTCGKTPEEEYAAHQRKKMFRALLEHLSSKEQEILTLRYGLAGAKPLTLEEVGVLFQVTRERIRQIQIGAIQKLKSYSKNVTQ